MMTRKDYELIASVVSNLYTQYGISAPLSKVTGELAAKFGEANPHFDHDRFVQACRPIPGEPYLPSASGDVPNSASLNRGLEDSNDNRY